MNKIRIYICILLIFAISFSLVCCNVEEQPKGRTAVTTLPSPTVICLDDIVSWNKINKATSYDVYIDGVFTANTSSTFYLVSVEGEHTAYVIAKGNGTTTADSVRSNKVTCKVEHQMSKQDVFSNFILQDGSWESDGTIDGAIKFVQEKQSMDADLFADFESVFTEHFDNDGGYRGEFWGKTLRGAVMCYRYTQNEELYNLLRSTVINVMNSQESNGRISGSDVGENEFAGWNLWGRTYVVLGMLHFYSVCKDETLKAQIIDCCKKQEGCEANCRKNTKFAKSR